MKSIKLRFEIGSGGFGSMVSAVKRGAKYGINGIYYDVTGAVKVEGTDLIEFTLTNGRRI